MANITITQETAFDARKGTNATSHTFTLGGATAVGGALLIAAIMDVGSAAGINATGITDNKSGGSNTWTQISRNDNASAGGAGIYATTVTGGSISTFTVALAGAGPCCAQFWEVKDAAAGAGTGGCDVKNSANGTSTAISSGSSGTPAGTGDLVIAVGGVASFSAGPALSAGALTTGGGTFATHNSSGAATQACGITARLLNASAAQTFTMTTDFGSWGACVALWKPAAATLLPPSRFVMQAVQRSAVR